MNPKRALTSNGPADGTSTHATVATQADLAWKLLTELRKEIIEGQRTRAQIVGFKITFVSAGIAVIVANSGTVPNYVLVIPAFAAIFFDLLINGCSISLKRLGFYCRTYIEPKLRESSGWPEKDLLWEEFMSSPKVRQHFSLIGNLGITCLAAAPALFVLFKPFRLLASPPLVILLMLLLLYDVIMSLQPGRLSERGFGKVEEHSTCWTALLSRLCRRFQP